MLETILLDNPEIDQAILRYCEAQPEYQALEADCTAKRQALRKAFIDWEDAESTKQGFLALAYYHMGLGVRQELFDTLELTARSAP